MISAVLGLGRALMVAVEPGEDLIEQVLSACRGHGIEQGYLPVFLGAFSTMTVIGSCGPVPDHQLPMADRVHLENVEGSGSGTLTTDPAGGGPVLHLHAAVGVKHYSANGYAGHVTAAQVQYVAEVVVQEVLEPVVTRAVHPGSAGLPILSFAAAPEPLPGPAPGTASPAAPDPG